VCIVPRRCYSRECFLRKVNAHTVNALHVCAFMYVPANAYKCVFVCVCVCSHVYYIRSLVKMARPEVTWHYNLKLCPCASMFLSSAANFQPVVLRRASSLLPDGELSYYHKTSSPLPNGELSYSHDTSSLLP